jgi:hypothetical protein
MYIFQLKDVGKWTEIYIIALNFILNPIKISSKAANKGRKIYRCSFIQKN